MAYQIVKGPRSGYLIDDGSGTSIRYNTRREAEMTIARWERQRAEAAIYRAEKRAARLEAAKAYLVLRAARKAEADKQGSFAF
jgi:hypothetical protein